MISRCRLSSVKCGPPTYFLLGMLFSSTICCSAILWQREKKGNRTHAPPPAAMIADQTQSWLTKIHEILTKYMVKLEVQRRESRNRHEQDKSSPTSASRSRDNTCFSM